MPSLSIKRHELARSIETKYYYYSNVSIPILDLNGTHVAGI